MSIRLPIPAEKLSPFIIDSRDFLYSTLTERCALSSVNLSILTPQFSCVMTSLDSFPQVNQDSPFEVPDKKINSDFDVARFNVSSAFDRIVGFILLLNESIKGKTCLDEDIILSEPIKAIGDVLDTLNRYVNEIPPSTGPRRFGNFAFRDWIR